MYKKIMQTEHTRCLANTASGEVRLLNELRLKGSAMTKLANTGGHSFSQRIIFSAGIGI